MEDDTANKSCRGRGGGRPRKKNNIRFILQKKQPRPQPSTSTETSMIAIVCRLSYGFNECVMRICVFFCSIDPTSPRDVNLQTVASKSVQEIAQHPTTFTNGTWSIKLQDKRVEGYRINETKHIDVHHDSFNLEMCADEAVIIGNLNYWFQMEEHKFTVFKCESKILGIVKCDGKYFLYDPNSNAIAYNNQSTCTLVDCSDTVILAQEIRRCMEGKDLSGCTKMSHLLAVTVTSSHPSTTAHTGRRSEVTINSNGKRTIQDGQAEVCGSSAKNQKCTDIDTSTPTMALSADCVSTTNNNELLLHIFSLFCVIDVSKPTHINLEAVIQLTGDFMAKYPDFLIEHFDFLQCTLNSKNLLIYKIFGLNAFNNELYENYTFSILCDKTIFVNNLKKWFAIGYHEKTVFQCAFKFFGLLKSETNYFLFDPNECLNVDGAESIRDTKITFSECSNVEQLADALYENVISKTLHASTFACSMFAVDTLSPILGSEDYVTTDPPTYERSSKVKGRIHVATLLSQENEFRLLEHRKKIKEKYAATQRNMTESERMELLKKKREYDARRWNNMDEAEKEQVLQDMREYSAKRWKTMTEAEKEQALQDMREYSAKRWKTMTEAEKEQALQDMREYSAKRWKTMTEAEKNEKRKKEREGRARKLEAMNAEEKADYMTLKEESVEKSFVFAHLLSGYYIRPIKKFNFTDKK